MDAPTLYLCIFYFRELLTELSIRHNELNKSISCDKCLRWDIMSNVSLCGTEPPKYYPIPKQNNDGKLYPIELNWKILLKVLSDSSEYYMNGEWSEKNCKTYLNCHGINNVACDTLISHCNNQMAKDRVIKSEIRNYGTDLITMKFHKEPSLFATWLGGPYWRSNVHFKSYIDAIMHLLFLGVTKASKTMLDSALNKLSYKATHTKKMRKTMNK